MKNLFAVRKLFMRQSGPNDCGIACLGMILNYTGKTSEANSLSYETPVPENGLSLLDLHKLAAARHLQSRSVQMNIDIMRENIRPCILHVLNDHQENHFVVCFSAKKRRGNYQYLIGDPAKHVSFITEQDLLIRWQSRAALYFDGLTRRRAGVREHPWISLLNIQSFQKTLLFSVPFLNICATFLGIALSWMLQRGINDSLSDKKTTLVIAVVILLFIITIFKSVIAYIRQIILIRLNSAVSKQFNIEHIKTIIDRKRVSGGINDKVVKRAMTDIQKIQNALSAFVSVLLSEGVIIAFIVAGLWYNEPLVGLVNTCYLAIICITAILNSPGLAYRTAHLNELSGTVENALIKEVTLSPENISREDRFQMHLRNHLRFTAYAKAMAVTISKTNFWYECLGTVNVIIVFVFSLLKMQEQAMSYTTLMVVVILSYFITALMPKICNVFIVITEGAQLIRRYQNSV
ncbi:MAG: cysteine peptidase family C39 domain-containing protein [Bacteroidota bacterium]